MIKTSVDISGVYNLAGAIMGMTATVKTPGYTDALLKYTHAKMAEDFNMVADVTAAAAKSNFHHVYEWNMVGNPAGRLWKHTFSGHGNNRVAGFDWKASKVPIPTPQQRAGNPDDPISQLDSAELAKLSNRRYFFYWKAPVMEYNQTVHIVGKYSPKKLLFIPSWTEHKIGGEMKPYTFAASATMSVPGGAATSGQFNALWGAWWASSASSVFDTQIRAQVERDLADSVKQTIRRRRKTVTISNGMADFEAGRAQAMAFLAKKIRTYDREGELEDE